MKGLSDPFIRRPVMTTLMMVALLVGGWLGYGLMPVSDLPDIDYPVIHVQASLIGASPEVMANTVAAPLEREFMTIPGLKSVKSDNSSGTTMLTLDFEIDKQMSIVVQDVEAAIARADPFLPTGMYKKPTYSKENPSQNPILFFAVSSDTLPITDLYDVAHNVIGKRISMQEGVAQVQVYGPKHQINVRVDPDAMAALDLDMGHVKNTIVQGNPHLPSGSLASVDKVYTLQTQGQIEKSEDYRRLIIKNSDGKLVELQDIATVEDGPPANEIYAYYLKGEDKRPSVVIAVQRLPGANTVKVSESIDQLIPTLQQELPQAIRMNKIFDRADSIRASIDEVEFTLILAILLVVLIIYLYLGKIRDTLIPSLTLPLAIVGTFFFLYFLGYSIDNLSLLALTLAVGFIIDDAIVVIENIVRHIEKGVTPLQAALQGSKEMSFTVFSMTLSLCASFIPLLIFPGIVGKIFREFSMTMALSIILSGFIALTLIPMLSSRMLSSRRKEGFNAFVTLFHRFNDWLLELYLRTLKRVLHYKEAAAVLALGSIGLTALLFNTLPQEFIPKDDIGALFAMVQTNEEAPTAKAVKKTNSAVEAVRHHPAIDHMIGWYFYGHGAMFIKMKDKKVRGPTAGVVGSLFQTANSIPGVRAFFMSIPLLDLSLGGGGDNRYSYMLKSPDFDLLAETTQKMVERLSKEPGFIQVTTNLQMEKPQIEIQLQRERASYFGITATDVERELNGAFSNNVVTTIELPQDTYDVTLGLQDAFKEGPVALDRFTLRSPLTGKRVPLSAVSQWKETAGPKSIYHFNQFPSSTIGFTLSPELTLKEALKKVKEVGREILPDSISGRPEGLAEVYTDLYEQVGFLVLVAFLVSYLVLGTLYESFIHPLTILISLPLALLGGLLTLFVTGFSLSLYSLVGLVLLMGIVKKNGIIMVNHAIVATRDEKKTPLEAILEACRIRFRPMMMTTLAAAMGAIPIAWGVGTFGDVRQPLGIVIVGGLMISQVFTLIFTPAVYLCFENLKTRFSTYSAFDTRDLG